ncbi:MAG: FtsH protease activity modulator HflK [Rhodospirillales bacterium]|nr:FtsH protease activity modulator HflK [Rhodospirillales bacterium]
MAWNPKGGPWGGGGGGGGGPWGSGPSSSPQPDIEEMLRRSQERLKQYMPGSFGGGRGLLLALLAIVGIWLATGFYRVQPGEQGVELLFGRYAKTTTPGLNWWFPTPIGEVLTPNVEQTNQITVGFRGGGEGPRGSGVRKVPQESLMLTGDQNIVDIEFIVQWRIKNAADYLFNMRDPEGTVKLAAESAIRETIGQTSLEDALTAKRQEVDDRTRELLQQILDRYQSGIIIVEVKQLKADPPPEVIDAFNDVQRARQDQERSVNEAQAYRNDIVPRAKGEAEKIIQDATAYREKVTRDADGEAQRFLSVYDAYLSGPDVTKRRLYLERMQEIMSKTQKVIIDSGENGGPGVVPYLPLPEVQKRAQEARR